MQATFLQAHERPAVMLSRIKRGALRLMHDTGLTSAIQASPWRKHRLLILGYHGTAQDDEHVWNPELYLSPQALRAQLDVIAAEGANVLSLADGLQRLYSGRLPERAVCLTFDDGTVDFYRTVYPMLREFGYPATLYLTTYYCFFNRPVFPPALAYILWRGRDGTAPYPASLQTRECMDLTTAHGRAAAQWRIWEFAEGHGLSGAAKHDLLEEVAANVGYDFSRMRDQRIHHLMTPDEVVEVGKSPNVAIELHAHRHWQPLSRDLYHREIADNRAAIELLTGRRPQHYCYPLGSTHPRYLEWLGEDGVVSATTCKPGIASPHGHPLLVPRLICDARLSQVELVAWLSGAAALLPRARHDPPREPVRAGSPQAA
jgi:peptidoglycan/xylan/chitin deacetylase (PgdA/CDA1 family)